MIKCKYCNEEIKIQITDDEGNFENEEYKKDPWSGLSFVATHDIDNNCPIATHEYESLGKYIYDSEEELLKAFGVEE